MSDYQMAQITGQISMLQDRLKSLELHVLPRTESLRLSAVLKMTGLSESTWRRGMKAGTFPKPIKLGSRIPAWPADEIMRFQQELKAQRAAELSVPCSNNSPSINLRGPDAKKY